jgi:hypothetical protein
VKWGGASLDKGKYEPHERGREFFGGLPVWAVEPFLGSAVYGPTDGRRDYFVGDAEVACMPPQTV